jgi:SAM-dependent methyltransferase
VVAPRIVEVANRGLRAANLRVEEIRPTTWDRAFRDWIAEARKLGVDPNDLGDEQWGNTDCLDDGRFYLPLISDTATVLELGPGSGRLTRHLVGRCRRLIAADFSPTVCRWLESYLPTVEIVRITDHRLPIEDQSVSVVVAHGVVEHLDLDILYLFCTEFQRVLNDDGIVAFNFDDLSTSEGLAIFRDIAGSRRPERFRVHHPEALTMACDAAGFTTEIHRGRGRISFALLRRR